MLQVQTPYGTLQQDIKITEDCSLMHVYLVLLSVLVTSLFASFSPLVVDEQLPKVFLI